MKEISLKKKNFMSFFSASFNFSLFVLSFPIIFDASMFYFHFIIHSFSFFHFQSKLSLLLLLMVVDAILSGVLEKYFPFFSP